MSEHEDSSWREIESDGARSGHEASWRSRYYTNYFLWLLLIGALLGGVLPLLFLVIGFFRG